MREFICGYQTLLTCGGELVGFGLLLLFLLGVALVALDNWLTERRKRKTTPHPETCWTVSRCAGAGSCWNVPSCAEARKPHGGGPI